MSTLGKLGFAAVSVLGVMYLSDNGLGLAAAVSTPHTPKVKYEFKLTVNSAEKSALTAMLNRC